MDPVVVDEDTIVRKLTDDDWIEICEVYGRRNTNARTVAVVAKASSSTIAQVRAFPKHKFEEVFKIMKQQGSFD